MVGFLRSAPAPSPAPPGASGAPPGRWGRRVWPGRRKEEGAKGGVVGFLGLFWVFCFWLFLCSFCFCFVFGVFLFCCLLFVILLMFLIEFGCWVVLSYTFQPLLRKSIPVD